MRMDQRQVKTAADVVNTYSENELFRIIRDYGEDKFAKNIAKHIVMERQKKPFETTAQLSEVIKHSIPMLSLIHILQGLQVPIPLTEMQWVQFITFHRNRQEESTLTKKAIFILLE